MALFYTGDNIHDTLKPLNLVTLQKICKTRILRLKKCDMDSRKATYRTISRVPSEVQD